MRTIERISNEALERYNARRTDAAETLAVQTHIGECAACREKLARVFDAENAFTNLRNDFAFKEFSDEPEHLPYEQLALFVDGKMDAVEREIKESHLAICDACAKAGGSEIVSPSSPAPPAKFRVLEQTAADELNRLEKSGVKSHLVRGTAFANAGLLDEAAKEFEALVRENPKSPLARKLLSSVKGKR